MNAKTVKYLMVISIITALLIVLTGCTDQSDTQPDTANKSVVIGMGTSPKTLDPRLSTDVASARVQQLLFNALIKKDKQSNLIPDLAESWTIVDDKTYRFKLRKNVQFHDGTLLTARDIKANFDAVISESLASPRKSAYDKLASISIIDDHTIVFETTEPFAPFLVNMILGILPEKEAEKIAQNESVQFIGTGPFKLNESSTDDQIVLDAFPDHFQGSPELDQVLFKVVPDDGIRLMELEKGSIDFIENNVPPDALKSLRENPEFTVVSAPGTSYYYMGFNLRLTDLATADVTVRKALAMALNRAAVIEHILGGLASAATSLLPASHWAFNPDIPSIPFDPVKAGELLDQAGYPLNEDGVRFQIEFKVSQNKQSRKLAEIIQSQWAAIGVTVKIQSLEWGTFYSDIVKGNFQSYVLSWVGVTDPDIYHSIYHSHAVPPNGRNRAHYSNPELDILLDTARTELDPNKRRQLYFEVQQIISQDLPCVSLWHTHNVAVMKSDIKGFELYPAGDLDSFINVSRN